MLAADVGGSARDVSPGKTHDKQETYVTTRPSACLERLLEHADCVFPLLLLQKCLTDANERVHVVLHAVHLQKLITPMLALVYLLRVRERAARRPQDLFSPRTGLLRRAQGDV